jgi:soluble lytic murein transglycosylase-like protein
MIGSFWVVEAAASGCTSRQAGSVPIETLIEENARRVGLPAAWIASVVAQESGGRNCRKGHAIESVAGAVGAMQLMRPTWAEINHRIGLRSSIEDPAANIAAGALYLRSMYDRFGYPGAFAAYNAGPGRYSQSLSGRPLPRETWTYVNAVVRQIEQKGKQGTVRLGARVSARRDDERGWSLSMSNAIFILKR